MSSHDWPAGANGATRGLCCWRTPYPCHPALARPLSDLTTAPPKASHSTIRAAAGCWLLVLRALPQNQRATERPLYHKARAARRNTDQEARWRPSDSSFNSIWPRSDQADPVRHSRKRPPGLSRKDAMAAPPAPCFPPRRFLKTPSRIKKGPAGRFQREGSSLQACKIGFGQPARDYRNHALDSNRLPCPRPQSRAHDTPRSRRSINIKR